MLNNAVKIIISNPLSKSLVCKKISGRKISVKNNACFQFEFLRDSKAFHENIALPDLPDYFERKMAVYKQADIWYENGGHTIVYNNGGILRSHKTKDKIQPLTINSHDNGKNYILKEGDNIPALCELGIFNKDFKIIKSMYSKFRQINHFIGIIDAEIGKNTHIDEPLRIIDFGCGKSYLTFVVYFYFTEIKKIPVHITGIDLKEDVISHCAKLAAKYNYKNLSFRCGDIKDYTPEYPPDMVISLHGCNTATDFAIYNGIRWKVDYMFVAPCCQQEINSQIENQQFSNLLKYGVLKERFSSILTDCLRANMLEISDYKTDMVEFVGFNHSPKNILIKAVKTTHSSKYKQSLINQTEHIIAEFNLTPALWRLLDNFS